MPAGFDVGGEDVSGANGAVVVLLETLARHAATRYGPADPLAAFLHDEAAGWFPGKYVFMDGVLTGSNDRQQFRHVLDTAVSELLAGGEWSESGQEWLRDTAAWFAALLDGPTASIAPPP